MRTIATITLFASLPFFFILYAVAFIFNLFGCDFVKRFVVDLDYRFSRWVGEKTGTG